MSENVNLDETLANLRELLNKYNECAKEFLNHNNVKEANHHLHELKAQLAHLKFMLHEDNNEKSEHKKDFLKEHVEAVNHAINHMQHLRLHMEHEAIEAAEHYELIEELKNAYHELKELYDKLHRQKELQEYFEHHAHVRPGATFYPTSLEDKE